MTDLADLIARVEGATEGSRELGVDILRALDPMYGKARRSAAMEAMLFSKENPTDSIDAALSLVERKLPGRPVGFLPHFYKEHAYAGIIGEPGKAVDLLKAEIAGAPTPALAICLALLRSLQAGAQN